jgi:hypothetical protein
MEAVVNGMKIVVGQRLDKIFALVLAHLLPQLLHHQHLHHQQMILVKIQFSSLKLEKMVARVVNLYQEIATGFQINPRDANGKEYLHIASRHVPIAPFVQFLVDLYIFALFALFDPLVNDSSHILRK